MLPSPILLVPGMGRALGQTGRATAVIYGRGHSRSALGQIRNSNSTHRSPGTKLKTMIIINVKINR